MATITFYHDAGLTRQITAMLAFIQKNAGRRRRAFKYAFMERFDVPFLGAGVNAMVFRLNTRKVIRLEFDPSPNGHLKWVRYCLKHQTMQSIPRIYVACTVPEQERAVACLVTVTELLIPLKKAGREVFANRVQTARGLHQFFFTPASRLNAPKVLSQIEAGIRPPFQGMVVPHEYAAIKKSMKKFNDLHEDNMMISPDKKRLVITDPISAWS